MSWLLGNPLAACAIVGATRPEQLEENVQAAGWALTREEMDEIDGFARSRCREGHPRRCPA
jgi:aryl-alcohol dehydrogenase-like predicted oxidoreductase